MTFERTMIYFLYTPYSMYVRMIIVVIEQEFSDKESIRWVPDIALHAPDMTPRRPYMGLTQSALYSLPA